MSSSFPKRRRLIVDEEDYTEEFNAVVSDSSDAENLLCDDSVDSSIVNDPSGSFESVSEISITPSQSISQIAKSTSSNDVRPKVACTDITKMMVW